MLVALGMLLVVVPPQAAHAAATVPFTSKFSTNANGAITTVGNNLLTCPASSTCTDARAGGSQANNSFAMTNLDADSDSSTFNSSASTLSLPQGATVLWAGLYWGARLRGGDGGSSASPADMNSMRLRTPGAGAYQSISASTAARDQFGPDPDRYNAAYQRFADITSVVRSAGNGSYWGADVAAGTGGDRYAGWAMTVVYSAPGFPLRNLTVFDGFNTVGQGQPQTVTVDGFLAPQSGTVDAQLSMIAYEGDLSSSGDYTRLNNTQLGTAISPGSNFFNSTNDTNGASVTSRTPADRNMLGYDIKNMGASGAIPNGATSATFNFASSGDVYYPGMLGLAINLYAPDFTTSSKTVVNLDANSPARPGDTLEYTIDYNNTGQDPAVRSVSEDVLPDNTTYVPGSLSIDSGPGAGPLSDASGDDRGEIDGRTVRVRLGTGATSTSGGTIGVGASTSYKFRVTVDDAAGGTTVTNLADLDYRTGTTGIAATYTTNPASIDVTTRADVAITKEMSPDPAAAGGEVSATLTVTNDGPNTAGNVIVRDPIPAGWTGITIDGPNRATCRNQDGEAVCDLGNVPNGATRTIRISGTTSSSSTSTSLTNLAYVSTDSYDPDLTDNSSSDTITLTREADLSITKSADPATAVPGTDVTYTLTARNNGASDARDVMITDAFADQSQIASSEVIDTTGGATCAGQTSRDVRCTVSTLEAGRTATVTVRSRIASDLAAGAEIDNTATVASATPDPDDDNNQAGAQVVAVAPRADVRLTKSGPDSVVAGTSISYTLTATNWGPSDAGATTLTDDIPAEIEAGSATTDRGTCEIQEDTPSAGGQRLHCDLGALPATGTGTGAGAAATVTLNGTVAEDASGELTNTGTASSTTADPEAGNNTASAVTEVTRSFDLAVAKRANRASLPAGAPNDPEPVDYTITVTNNGPSVATDVTVTDLVPTALDFLDATADGGGSCADPVATDDPDHDRVVCTLANPIPVGGSQTVTVRMQAIEDLTGGDPVTETVSVTAPDDDTSELDNNEATWTLSGEPYSDLSLEKSVPETVTAGTMVTYTFDITNNPIPPDNLTALAPWVRDTLPDGVTLVPAGEDGSVTPTWCTAEGQDVTCNMPRPAENIEPGETARVKISVRIAPDVAPGTDLVNTARVDNDPSNPDPAPANNTSTATSTVVADADVAVSGLTAAPTDPVQTGPGTAREISFTLTNNGPSTAKDVRFRVAVDPDAAVEESSLAPHDCSLDNGELVCTIAGGDLAPGESVDISFSIVLAGYVAPGPYVDGVRAHVSSITPDAEPDNNDDATDILVGPARTDLQIAKDALDTTENPDDGHPAYVAGQSFAYQIQVSVPSTPGYADAQDVVVTDRLPDGFEATAVSTTQGTCEVVGAGAGIVCQVGAVAAFPNTGDPVMVTVHGNVSAEGEDEQVENTATAVSSTPGMDGGPTSVSDGATVDVIEHADLRLYKVADEEVFHAGGSVGYTLTVVNAGPSDVEQARIIDRLPVGLTLDAEESPGCEVTGTAADGGQEVTCVVDAIDVGESASVRLVATTAPDTEPRTVTNTATVSSGATDPTPDNNTATVDVRIDRLADVAITSAVSTTTPAAGEYITFTADIQNNGPSNAYGNTIDIVFPAGFVPVRWEGAFDGCTFNRMPPARPTSIAWEDFSYEVHCERARAFEPGASEISVVEMYVPGDTPAGTYDSSGRVDTETPESTLENNTTAGQVNVQRVSDTSVRKTLVGPDALVAGRPATWRLTVQNHGPSVASQVIVSDVEPDGMSYVSAEWEDGRACPEPEVLPTPGGDVADEELIVRCRVDGLRVGETATALVTFDIDAEAAGRTLCNNALVGSGSLDPVTVDDPDTEVYSSNEDESCGLVARGPEADVSIDVSPDDDTVRPGDKAHFTAVVRNNGPDPATGVVARYPVPEGFTDLSGVVAKASDGTSPDAECRLELRPTGRMATTAQDLVCTIGTLRPGQQVTYRLTGVVSDDPPARITLTGFTVHGEKDSDPSNDTDGAVVRTLIDNLPSDGPPPGDPSDPGAPLDPDAGPSLPDTGGPAGLALVLGLLLTGAGLGLTYLSRRRRGGDTGEL